MEQHYRQLQRATVARSALDVIALIFLGCGFAFWSVAFWQLLGPPAPLSLLTIQVIVLALVYSLATPLLWSALVPSTPAGQLLQKTQWRTFGFGAIVASAIYLSYQAETMIELWLWAQPGIAEAGFARSLAISLSIGFILIPALAWTQLTPERWLQQIQQAHQVKKLEMQQRGELTILKASILRSERLALKGWANLLPLEKEEVFHTVRGLIQSTSDIQRDIVRTMGLSSDLERDIMHDDAIADQLDYVKNALDVLPDIAPLAREGTTATVYSPMGETTQPHGAHVDTRSQSLIPRDDQPDHVRLGRTVYDAIAHVLPAVFTAGDVSDRMRWTDKREGQRVIRAWLDDGRAEEVRLGRYSLTERGGA